MIAPLLGALCAGNALRNWQNGITSVAYRLLSTGILDIYSLAHFSQNLLCFLKVLSYTTQVNLLFTDGPRDRKSPSRIKAADGISNRTRRYCRGKREGT